MKKILAMVMAIVMMMAIAVPAFAADITVDGGKSGTTIVTDTSAVGSGSFTVTIPAKVEIVWGATSTDVNYTITSQLETGKCVKVVVSGNNAMKNTNNDLIEYGLAQNEYKASAAVVNAEAAKVVVDVAEAAWNAASIDVYEDTLTFTASVVAL